MSRVKAISGATGISIHTPAKGVTRTAIRKLKDQNDFNPHSREGSDETIKDSHKSAINFNPHSREGSDGALDEKKGKQKDFNPHSREGSDVNEILYRPYDTISIHTPAKGVTLSASKSRIREIHFNPHSREGSDDVVRLYSVVSQ